MIFHKFVLGDLVTNCYIIADDKTKNAVLFDAPAEASKIIDFLNKNNLVLKKILLTHAHFDHILALHALQTATGAECILHKDEEQYLSNPDLNLSNMNASKIAAVTNYNICFEGDVIRLDGIIIKVIHTPGHTAGSVCYLVNNDILISGDTLFAGSIGRFDFPLGSFESEISSIKTKLMPLDDTVKVYPGHGFSTTIGKQRKENPYLI